MSLAKLILAKPFHARKHILLNENPFVIGRADDCNFILDRPGISKHHTSITFDQEEYIIEDLQSKNGTLVNGEQIKQAVLKDHDLITMAGEDLTFRRIRQDELNQDLERNVIKYKSALESTRAIKAHLMLDPVLDEIMDALMRLTQAERGFLLVQKEGEMKMARSVNITSRNLKERRFRLSWSAVEKAIETMQSVAISNAMDDRYFGDQSSVREMELKTLVCIPIVVEDQVIGILYADSKQKELEFTQLDLEVLEYLAANAGIAIENAKLNQEIWGLIQKASDVLGEVGEKAHLDKSLQNSIKETLHSLTSLKKKRVFHEKESVSRGI